MRLGAKARTLNGSGFLLSQIHSGSEAAMSDRLAAVDAALATAIAADRFLEEAAIESCQQGVVDYFVREIAELQAARTALGRLP